MFAFVVIDCFNFHFKSTFLLDSLKGDSFMFVFYFFNFCLKKMSEEGGGQCWHIPQALSKGLAIADMNV